MSESNWHVNYIAHLYLEIPELTLIDYLKHKSKTGLMFRHSIAAQSL